MDERSANLERIYGVRELPSDTAMREGIDGILPEYLQECFRYPLQVLEKEGIMNSYKVLGRYTKTMYHHQALGCVLAHPDHKAVFRVAAEAIVRQDGATKNDWYNPRT